MKINNNNKEEKGLVMITRTNWPAVVGLCFTLSVGWYSLAIVPLKQTQERQLQHQTVMRADITAMKIKQGMNAVTLESFKESIDRLNNTLEKLEERIR